MTVATPLVTFTLFGFPDGERGWALREMGFARPRLHAARGLRFWKLLGSGHGRGFSLRPNFARYGLLAVWESKYAADNFMNNSSFIKRYAEHTNERWTARMVPLQARGAWSGVNPFLPVTATQETPGGPVAVLTRATLRWSRLRAFWGAVPSTSVALDGAEGLLASIGVGELPYLRQATMSFWQSDEAVHAFAYRDPTHREVIRRTRDEGWYREELFARFRPVGSDGTWNGHDPLAPPPR